MAEIALECRPLEVMSDERLARLAAAGDDRAFAVLYARYQAPLRAYCGGILRADGSDADDAVQTTMARALAGLRTRRDGGSWRAWLFRIARNESLEVLRRRRPTADLDAVDYVGPWSVEATLEQRERLSRLLEDLDDLPERQRSALVLQAMNGLEPQEIGDALAMSAGAARQAIHEARSALVDFEHGRDMACEHVRFAVETGDGRRLRERRLRAHLRACAECRSFRDTTRAARRRRAFVPSLGFLSALAHRLQGSAGTEGALATKAVAAVAALAVTTGLAVEAPRIARHAPPGAAAITPAPSLPAQPAAAAARVAALAPPLTAEPAVVVRRHHATAPRPVARRRPAAIPVRPVVAVHAPAPAVPAPAAAAEPPSFARPVAADEIAAPPAPQQTSAASSSPPRQPAPAPATAPAPAPATPAPAAPANRAEPSAPPAPPGQAKKDDPTAVPPGQAKKDDPAALPPGQAKQQDDSWMPPGQAKQGDAGAVPPGQAKKNDPEALPPGQAKKDDADPVDTPGPTDKPDKPDKPAKDKDKPKGKGKAALKDPDADPADPS